MDERAHELAAPLTVAKTCEVLNITRPTVYKLARTGELRMIRLGRAIRIPRADVERLAGIR